MSPRDRPGRGRRRAAAAGGVVTLTAAGIALASAGGGSDQATAQTASRATAITRIQSRDLVETEEVDGTLGYSDARKVVNRLGGTVTRTPKVGAVVKIDQALYQVDGKNVYLLDGAYPAYRTLTAGLEGDDVRQLERNLRELGLDEDRAMQVDGTWDAGTTAAVRRWQRGKGMDDDGSIETGRIVFQPGARRIGAIDLVAGSSAGGAAEGGASEQPASAPTGGAEAGPPGGSSGQGTASSLMTTTSTRRIVTVDLETTLSDLAEKGTAVEVELPAGEEVEGRIARVGRIAKLTPAREQDDDPPATIKLIIRLKRSSGLEFDQAPVDVRLEKERVTGALTIPVTALLARQGGTFAVEVREGGRRRIIRVETGLYTDGDVQIEGRGLRAGMKVTNAEV